MAVTMSWAKMGHMTDKNPKRLLFGERTPKVVIGLLDMLSIFVNKNNVIVLVNL